MHFKVPSLSSSSKPSSSSTQCSNPKWRIAPTPKATWAQRNPASRLFSTSTSTSVGGSAGENAASEESSDAGVSPISHYLGESAAHHTDLRYPHEFYPLAREMKRKIFLHIGPTNSGKTHNAVEALKSARTGVFCGPLRLLAWEMSEKLNNDGIPCDLLTGQEREEVRLHLQCICCENLILWRCGMSCRVCVYPFVGAE